MLTKSQLYRKFNKVLTNARNFSIFLRFDEGGMPLIEVNALIFSNFLFMPK
jgi:hypothetical protein